MSAKVPGQGRIKLDFERLIKNKCGVLDLRTNPDGTYADARTHDLYTAFKLGTRNLPTRAVADGQGVQSILTRLDDSNEPHLLRTFDYRNSAIRVAKVAAAENRGNRYAVYSLHTIVHNPKSEVEDATTT